MYITQDTFDQWLREIEYTIAMRGDKEDAAREILMYLETQGVFEVVAD